MKNLGKNPPLNKAELKNVKRVFDLYKDKQGRINPHEVISSMQALHFDEKNPVIFDLLAEFDTPENARNGIEYEDFVDQLNEKLADKESKHAIERVYAIFLENSDKDVITFDTIKRVSDEVGGEMTDDEIRGLLERAANDGKTLSFDEFYNVMTKQASF